MSAPPRFRFFGLGDYLLRLAIGVDELVLVVSVLGLAAILRLGLLGRVEIALPFC